MLYEVITQSISGGLTLSMVTVNEQLALLPSGSVTIYLTVETPGLNSKSTGTYPAAESIVAPLMA